MFKLESYITPLILSYVDKYVKNARADKSQVSLWGGDVVFSNLDLRLDVLEKELGLPFTFVSGHIHELHINVPWTRLNTEPIVITINTIECVFRLPDASMKSQDGSEASSVKGEKKKPLKKVQQDQQPPPGYVQSLINKIISNVKIVCNNLILKYVEDDIVLSLNTRWLCLAPANALWEPAFVEFGLPDLVIRKVLQVKDMTVCLDKRDAAGRIDTYQEPLLYRCSMTAHAAWVYDSLTNKVPRITRYDIRSAQMEFSLTDTQLPMFLRIVKLVLALYYGQIQDESQSTSTKDAKEDLPATDTVVDMSSIEDENIAQRPSLGGWAWSVGSTIGTALLPIYWEDDEDEDMEEDKAEGAFDPWREKVFHLGFYVDEATFSFKLTEKRNKEIQKANPARLTFTPLLRLECNGTCLETRSIGVHTVNVSGGISSIKLLPMGDCACGERDTVQVTQPEEAKDQEECPYVFAGDVSRRFFLKGSLFEKDFGDEEGTCKERKAKYNIDWDQHIEHVNEDSMLDRTPALAMDMLYFLQLPDDVDSEQLSCISNLESSEMSEKALTRLVIGPCQVKICSGACHRLNCMLYFLSKYDYPPYANSESAFPHEDLSLSPNNAAEGKVRVYQLTAINPCVFIYAADHPNLGSMEDCLQRRWQKSDNLAKMKISFTERLTCQISLDCLDSQVVTPMYPPRPDSMMRCYATINVKLMQLSCRLLKSGQGITWLHPCGVFFKAKKLLLSPIPPDWTASLLEATFELDAWKMRLSRPQWLLLLHVHSSWSSPCQLEVNNYILQDAMTKKLPSLHLAFKGFQLTAYQSKLAWTVQCQCQELSSTLGNLPNSAIPLLSTVGFDASKSSASFPVSPGRAQNRRRDESKPAWLRLDFQWPTSSQVKVLPLCSLQIGQVQVNLDPKLNDWIGYQAQVVKPAANSESKPQSLKGSICSKKTKKESTILQTDQVLDEISSAEKFKAFLSSYFEVLNSLLIQVQIDPVLVFAPRKSLAFVAACGGALERQQRKVKEALTHVPYIGIELPTIILENVTHKPMIQQFLSVMPYSLPESLWNLQRDNLPWTLKLTQFSVFSTGGLAPIRETILDSISTSCTVSLNAKNDGFAVCVHADMTPLKVHIHDDQLSHLISLAERLLHSSSILCPHWFESQQDPQNFEHLSSSSVTEKSYAVKMRGHSTISSYSNDKKPSLSDEFFDEELKLGSEAKAEGQISLWVQWTLPQASLVLLTNGKQRLVFSVEDYQSSFDWSPIYFQAKLRVLSASIKHQIENNKEWVEGPNKGLVMTFANDITADLETVQGNRVELLSTERSLHLNKTSFSLCFTKAECNHLHSKWKKVSRSMNFPVVQHDPHQQDFLRFINEVDLKVAPVDIVIDIGIFLPFTKMLNRVINMRIPGGTSAKAEEPICQYHNNSLPLLYVRAMTLRLFLPMNSSKEQDSDFILCHCEAVSITPQVDNPISRILVRPDIYHRSQSSLDIPGAPVENRQYQFDVRGLGIFSGNWKEVLKQSQTPERPAELKTRSENPALEWNIASTQPQKAQQGVILLPMLKKFDLQIIAAPAIVLFHPLNPLELVAGHSVEINALTDIFLSPSLGQLRLCSLLLQEALAAQSVLSFKPYQNLNSKSNLSVPVSSDSGVDCSSNNVPQKPEAVIHEVSPAKKWVPFEMLVTGRALSASFHRVQPYKGDGKDPKDAISWRKLKIRSFRRVTSESLEESENSFRTKSDIGYDASEEGSATDEAHNITTVQPLLFFSINQPHFFITASMGEQRLEMCIYDLILSLPHPNHVITCSGGRCLPAESDFTKPIILTRPGEPSRLSGIPPALLTLTAKEFFEGNAANLSVKMERPVKINVSLDMIKSLTNALKCIHQSLETGDIFSLLNSDREEIKKSDSSWVSNLEHVSNISLATEQFVFVTAVESREESNSLQLGFYATNLSITPKSAGGSLNEVLVDLQIEKALGRAVKNRHNSYRLFGPFSLQTRLEAYVTDEKAWPLMTLQLQSPAMNIFIGRESHQILQTLLSSVVSSSSSDSDSFNVMETIAKVENSEQHYSDDLRAGAFHFVEKAKFNWEETNPYQVVFTDSPLAMTWRYPKPRAITRLTVYPVPFIAADPSGNIESDVTIECSLEFWDKCLKSFQTYAMFTLSESNTHHLDLPLISDSKRLSISDTWRVVLHYFSEDESKVIVKPQSLVSVIRVDSYFSLNLLPQLKLSLKMDQVKMSLVNQTIHLPSLSTKASGTSQEMAIFSLDSSVIGADCWITNNGLVKINGRLSSIASLSCIDFHTLANHHVILPCRLTAQAFGLLSPTEEATVDVQFRMQNLIVKVGHFQADSLANINRMWSNCEKLLTGVEITNCTQSHLRIGQADTDESLMVGSGAKIPYVWRSQKARLMLRCSTESAIQMGVWRWTEPFSLREGSIAVRIHHDGYHSTLIVSMKKSSATKFEIRINGLITTASLLRESLETRIVLKRNFGFLSNLSESGKDDLRFITKGHSVTHSHLLEANYVQSLKVRLLGIGTPWSGDIPFDSKKSVLVKIPSKDRGKCITIWCRCLTEELDNGSKRFLFLLSPLYMARSLLPNPLRVIIQANNKNANKVEMLLEGGDQPVPLETSDSPDTKYLLSFKVNEELPASEPFLLSWGIIEQIREKESKQPEIESILDQIEMQTTTQWPFVDFKNSPGVFNDQPKTDVQVTLTQFHPLCNTVCAEINPWCLLINQLDMTLLLKANEKIFSIRPQSVLVPPALSNQTFYIGLESGFYSQPLQLTDQEWHFQNFMPSVEGLVPMEGVCHCKIVLNSEQICLFSIKTKNEKGMRVISIVPTIFLVNQIDQPLQAAALSVFGQYEGLEMIKFLPQQVKSRESTPLLYWQICGSKSDGLFDGFQHLALSMSDTLWSDLLNMDECRNLTSDVIKNLSLPLEDPVKIGNRLVILTLHQRNGQVFIVVQENPRPHFVVHNNLSVPLYFSTQSPATKTRNVYKVPAQISFGATFPTSVESISKVENNNALVKCFLSAMEQAKREVGLGNDWEVVGSNTNKIWSEVVDTNSVNRDNFLAIPGYGDSVIRVERLAGRVHLYVDPFSGREISAKDIRGRIADSSDEMSETLDSFCTLYSPKQDDSEYFSALAIEESSNLQLCLTFLCDEISVILADDCIENPNQIDEYVRITLETVMLTMRPRVENCVLRSGKNSSVNDVCFTIGHVQVDNQMHSRGSFDFPVILKGRQENKVILPTDFFRLSSQILAKTTEDSQFCLKFVTESDDGIFVKSISIKISPLDLFIEDVFVYKMVLILKSFSGEDEEIYNVLTDVKAASGSLACPTTLESLEINPINVLVSIHASVKAYVGLDQSPLQFGRYHRDFVRTTYFALGQSIARHYISGTLFRAGWVVGSLEMIGSPTGLTRAIGDGIRDFVALPYHGMLNGPWAFVRGITHGSSSLVKHVSAGTLTSVTNFASSISRNLDRLSLDTEHCQRNELARRNLPQGVGHGLVNGMSGIGISILGAIGGLAHHPIKSLIEQGASPTGLVGGFTRGLMGVVTKPLGGAAEFVAQTGQGLLVGTGWAQRPKPKEISLPQPICGLSSSSLKYEWKLDCGMIIKMAEVTMEKEVLTPASLILTSEALIIVNEDEDSPDRVFAILDAKLKKSWSDPTRLELIQINTSSKPEQEDIINERIVQFVLGTSAPNKDEEGNEEKLVFFANHVTVVAFYDAFQVAKAHLKRHGFPILM